MKLGSLFDGIGGFPLAASRYKIEPVWASEIEPFPIRVSTHHFPNMKHLGDITKINGAEIEPVDIITFGSPCTRLSVAGKHDGFDINFECQGNKDSPHEIYSKTIRATDKYQYEYTTTCPVCGQVLFETNESALFFHAIRVIREMRDATNGKYPRFAVWENVPGAFSSNKGEDFRAVLSEIAETEIPMPRSGKWANAGMVRTERVDVAWRVLNAQYWGVPQRRRRIFLVADFGGQCAGEILFIEQGLRGDTAESGEAREGIAADAERSIGKAKQYLFENHSQDTRYVGPLEVSPTVSATFGMGGNNQPFVVNRAYSIQGSMIGRADKNGPQGDGINEDVSFTLNTTDRHAVAFAQGGMAIVQCIEPGALSRGQGERVWDKCPTLRANMGDNQPAVVQTYQKATVPLMANSHPGSYTGQDAHSDMLVAPYQETVGFLCARDYKGIGNQYVSEDKCIIAPKYSVRRLTPLECLRLQGYPDWWLDIEGASDTAKYKAIGNSVAIPCVQFIMRRIKEVIGSTER